MELRRGGGRCGGVVEAAEPLWRLMARVVVAAAAGGGELEVGHGVSGSGCLRVLLHGLRLLGFRAEWVSSTRLVVGPGGEQRGRGLVVSECGLLPFALLAPLAAVSLRPGAQLHLRSSLLRGSPLLRGLVEAASLLGARAWPGEQGDRVVVEGAPPRRMATGRLYSGWLPLVAGLVVAAAYSGTGLAVTIHAPRLLGEAWLEEALSLAGLAPGEVLRGSRVVLAPGRGLEPRWEQVGRPRGGAAQALLAVLPMLWLGGEAELKGLEGDAAEAAAGLARSLGFNAEAHGGSLRVSAEPGAALSSLLEGGRDPDVFYLGVAHAAAAAGGGAAPARVAVLEGYRVPEQLATGGAALRLSGDSVVAEAGGTEPGAATRDCGGNVAVCAALYGALSAGRLPLLRGAEALADRFPGVLQAASMLGCVETR